MSGKLNVSKKKHFQEREWRADCNLRFVTLKFVRRSQMSSAVRMVRELTDKHSPVLKPK